MGMMMARPDLPMLRPKGAKQQCAALCYRMKNGKVQVLLITSRGTKRWIIPKGWQVKGRSMAQSAVIEAWEEAGVIGRAKGDTLGQFNYIKSEGPGRLSPCTATVFAVKVKSLKSKFPERGQRRLKWLGRKKAAAKVADPALGALIRDFDPRQL